MAGMLVVKDVKGIKIQYSPFFKQFIVLLPKGDGCSQMERFPSIEDAEKSIRQGKDAKDQNTRKYWWMQDN